MANEAMSGDFLERIAQLSPKRLALLAAELERRLRAFESATPEPIAIVGLGCRMPGGAETPDAFWDALVNGNDVIEKVPSDRWDVDAFYDPVAGTLGKVNSKWGGFVGHIDEFDTAFFGIAPKEAIGMDPQQRMLLEVSWEALENACIRAESLDGGPTGVFIGMSTSDYGSMVSSSDDTSFDAYSGSGVAHSVAAGRISYLLGLKGPSLVVDTACSSSALAIHLACQSLRQKECHIALAGGVNALLTPQLTISLSQAHMLAGDGRCKTFSQSADGFVRSEGCGIIVLKRLTDAQEDGDRILGVVRGSATNHDGRSSGLTAPNGPSQEAVIKAALAQAAISPEQVAYVEAHGTGTVLGDAIELGALGGSFTARREAGAELMIGSVKTNIGHMEAAAGVAGVIKVLLAMQHEKLPAHLHFGDGNPNEALKHLPFKVPIANVSWLASNVSRIAGVSSFGFSGTNVHIVLEEGPSRKIEARDASRTEILTFSAKSKEALAALCARYVSYLRSDPDVCLADLAFSLNAGRSLHPHRLAIKAVSIDDAIAHLQSVLDSPLEGNPAYRLITGYQQPSIGFLFTGQGSQYPGMGSTLYGQSSVFRDAIDRCDKVLAGRMPYRLAAILTADSSVPEAIIHDTTYTQPTLFAFEYALAMLWRSWGVRPSIVLGHSLGEYVAACIAGVFPLKAALTLAYERGRLMGSLPSGGSMLAVRCSEAEVTELIRPWDDISIAAVNGPRSVVVSGGLVHVEALRNLLTTKGIASQALTVSHAFHSALMDPILNEFEQTAKNLEYSEPEIAIVSNVTGELQTSASQFEANYWRRHLRGTVHFERGLGRLLAGKPVALLEIGPDPTLLAMGRSALLAASIQSLASVRRGKNAFDVMEDALIELYLQGVAIDWSGVYRDRVVYKIALPTYPFERQRYWIQAKRHSPSAKSELDTISKPERQYDDALYVTEWLSQPQFLQQEQSTQPIELVRPAERTIQILSEDPEAFQIVQAYENFLPSLNSLCAAYILQTLNDLGLRMEEGTRISSIALQERCGVGKEHHRLLDRMFEILKEDSIVCLDGEEWIFQAMPTEPLGRQEDVLLAEYPQFTAELDFLRQSRHLADVLRGRLSPVEALFPNGSFKLAERVYQDSPSAMTFNRSVAAVMRNAVEAYSSSHPGQPVRIVEVGAGTGSTTSQVLPALEGQYVDYLFTDISSAFFTAAKAKFSAYPFIRYEAVDLESKEPSALEAGDGADIILAANVLHATADLKQTLLRVKRLLRKGGSLVILEGTAPQRFADLTVGMTDGWWRFTDTSIRESYPLISRDQWLSVLADAGFEVAALPSDTALSILTEQQSILIARRPFEDTERHPVIDSTITVVGRDQAKLDHLSAIVTHTRTEQILLDVVSASSFERSLNLVRRALEDGSPQANFVLDLRCSSKGTGIPDEALETATILLEVLQSAVRFGSARSTLWVLTENALPVGLGGPLVLSTSMADAMVRTARLEHPDLALRCVDLSSQANSEDLSALSNLIRGGTMELTLAIRDGRCFTPRLTHLNVLKPILNGSTAFKQESAYLVTGAFGGLGFRTVRWMIHCGATCIIMSGRREPSKQLMIEIEQLRSSGVRIEIRIADVSEPQEVEDLFSVIGKTGLPLRGIVHAAGTLSDATLLQQTQERLSKVFASKVRGSWLLHEASKSAALDFFVLFGSAASVLGAPGQSNHAAANGFLDALSHFRRSMSLPSTTIAWGPWSEIGAAIQVKGASRTAWAGMGAFTPDQGIELLNEALVSAEPNVSALPLDWKAYLPADKAQSMWAFFDRVKPSAVPVSSQSPTPDTLSVRLRNTPPEGQLALLRDYLRERISNVLLLDPKFVLREDQSFAELGLDSLMALELKNDLQKSLDETLPSSFFFEYPTLEAAATFLNAKLMRTGAVAATNMDMEEREELAL